MKSALASLVGVALISFSLFGPVISVSAQTTAGTPVTQSNYKAPQNTNYAFLNFFHTIFCMVTGGDLMNPGSQCLGYDPSGNLLAYNQLPDGGAIGGISTVMTAMYTAPPVSATDYLASVGSNFGLVQPAYAQVQGSGSDIINPVLHIWQVSRNLSYLIFILIFVVVGFMIMFRQKINQQTVVTVQAAIPGLVVGLILITFSYFIAALIVDFAFVGVQLVALLLKDGGVDTTTTLGASNNAATYLNNNNVLTLIKDFVFNGDRLNTIAGPLKDAFMNAFPGGILNNGLGFVLGGVLGVLAMVVICVAVAVQMFRLLWELVKAYITILIMTVLGPFMILAASLPGQGGRVGAWWRAILANTLIFPAVYGAFLFAGVFIGSDNSGFCDKSGVCHALPLFAGLPIDVVKLILGYGIILALPGLPKLIKEALKAPDNPLGQEAVVGITGGYNRLRAGYQGLTTPIREQTQEFRTNRARARAGTLPSGVDAPTWRWRYLLNGQLPW